MAKPKKVNHEKKSSYALIALALLAGVAIGHVTSQAVAGSACGINVPGSRISIYLVNDNEFDVTVYDPCKIVQARTINSNLLRVEFSK